MEREVTVVHLNHTWLWRIVLWLTFAWKSSFMLQMYFLSRFFAYFVAKLRSVWGKSMEWTYYILSFWYIILVNNKHPLFTISLAVIVYCCIVHGNCCWHYPLLTLYSLILEVLLFPTLSFLLLSNRLKRYEEWVDQHK